MSQLLPAAFEQQTRAILGSEWDAFVQALHSPAPVSVRLNPSRKWNSLPASSQPVSWCPGAYYLPERPAFITDPAFHAGAYYVQEASSMFLSHIWQGLQWTATSKHVLDLCAAPGGKSTLLQSLIQPGDILVSNEVIRSRVSILEENLVKWGYSNKVITHADPSRFKPLNGFFDLVLIDAPCSGEGMFRKDPGAVGEWSPSHVELCAARQERILDDAILLVKEGGYLVYSTCTYNRSENEQQMQRLLDTGEWKPVDIPVDARWNIDIPDIGYRFWPHRTKGEGLYICCLQRISGGEVFHAPRALDKWDKAPDKILPGIYPFLQAPDDVVYRLQGDTYYAVPAISQAGFHILKTLAKPVSMGLELGVWMKDGLQPSHALALSNNAAPYPAAVNLDTLQALRFLRKETFPPASDWPRGWVRMQWEGLALGWAKILPQRFNNYLPKNQRILKEIDFKEQ